MFNTTVLRYNSRPHLCKITAKMLSEMLRYCTVTEGALFSFSPRNCIMDEKEWYFISFIHRKIINTNTLLKMCEVLFLSFLLTLRPTQQSFSYVLG